MRYQGSEAFDLDMQTSAHEEEPRRARSLYVVQGGHLDADARRGVSDRFVRNARLVVVAVVVLCVLGALRVFLTANTVALSQNNLKLQTEIRQANELNDELQAERSLLSSASRIKKIATQNLGMVYNPATTSIDAQQGSVDAAQDAD